jgi:hypothetical protein
MEYGVDKFYKNLRRTPYMFRAGGYQINRETLLATKAVGIPCVSNYRSEAQHKEMVRPHTHEGADTDIFRWDNGLLEVPVDICLDPLLKGRLDRFKAAFETLLNNKSMKTLNVLMHSWGLTTRNSQGHHLEHNPVYEQSLHEILDYLSTMGTFVTYPQMVQAWAHRAHTRPISAIIPFAEMLPGGQPGGNGERTDNVRQCNICGTRLLMNHMKNDIAVVVSPDPGNGSLRM